MDIKLPKIKFLKPKYRKNLVLDTSTFNRHNFFSNNNDYNALCTRYEEFYFTPLIKSLFKFIIYNKKLTILQIYILETIKWLNPRVILSFTEYNYFFLDLKNYFPEKKIIIFQCTFRHQGILNEQIKNIKILMKKNNGKLKLDYFFIYGKKIIKYYKNFFKTKFITCGVVGNNLKTKKLKINKNSLVIISHFTNNYDIYKIRHNKIVNTLHSISNYCKLNNLDIVIFGRMTSSDEKDEIQFYSEIFKGLKFKYYSRSSNNYKNSEKYFYFISFTSTLGYELATKYKRVAFVYGSLIQKPVIQNRFAYPQNLKKKGNFWTYSLKEKEIFRILDFIRHVSNKNWKSLINKIIRPVIYFDYDNKKIKKIFRETN